jgi:RHH-type rel operon transcriptional repressor/antitoxin RelB
MLALPLKSELEKRLAALAAKTGKTEEFYALEAIEDHIEDLEDGYTALHRIQNPTRILSSEKVEREILITGNW